VKKVCLIVMDGWGVNPASEGDATAAARTPNLDRLGREYPYTTVETSGEAVGLPAGQMGNSEVGHLTLGAGRVVFQELTRINRDIESGALSANPVLGALLAGLKETGRALHLMGLVSDGGVHSHIDHLYALLGEAARAGLGRVFVHAFLDGRDTPPMSGLSYMKDLVSHMEGLGTGRVATVSGRYYAMDRDNRWDRIERAYRAVAGGSGEDGVLNSMDALAAVEEAYAREETDEFVSPTVITGDAGGYAGMEAGDGVIFFNFRADRARELTAAFVSDGFEGFDRGGRVDLAEFVTMTEYDERFGLAVLFETPEIVDVLGSVLSSEGLKQFRVAETEKYAHVTFFFNGGREEPYAGEQRLLIPSDREVATYDARPEMRAMEIARAAAGKIGEGEVSFVLLNLANGDMVGHTGVMEAAVRACEAVDRAVGVVVDAAHDAGWTVIITSDHGNAEMMVEPGTEEPHTAHTTHRVPLIIVDDELKGAALRDGCGLRDIAPTILRIMGIKRPRGMEGSALV